MSPGDAREHEDPKAQWTSAPGARRAAWLLLAGLGAVLVFCALLAWRINQLGQDIDRLREEMKVSHSPGPRPTPATPALPR